MAAKPKRDQAQLIAAAIFVLGLGLAYGSLNSPMVLDDEQKIVNNPDLRRGGLVDRLIYPYDQQHRLNRNDPSRPLVFATYRLNYTLGGLAPFAYHLVNALLHALNGALVFLLARRLLRPAGESGDGLAAVVALLFVSAPINTATAIYVYGRSDLLLATWLFLGAWLFMKWRAGRRNAFAAALVVYVLALFTKQSAVVMPFLLLAIDYLVVRPSDPKLRHRGLAQHAPFLVVTALYLIFRLAYFGTLGDAEGAGNLWKASEYMAVQPYAIARYLGSALVPIGLSIDHQILPEDVVGFTPQVVVGWLVLVALAAALWRLARRPEPWARLVTFAGGWFLICLAPTSSILPTVDAVVERRAYAASFGVYFALVLLAEQGLAHLKAKKLEARRWYTAATVAALLGFSGVTLYRNWLHADEGRLWKSVATAEPRNARAATRLAMVHINRGQFAEAAGIYENLLAAFPGYAQAWSNLGNIYEEEANPNRDAEKALAAYERAMALSPNYAGSYYNAARLYQRLGDNAHAAPLYERALAINPNHVLAHSNLGLLYTQEGRYDEARREYQTALRIDPDCQSCLSKLQALDQVAP